MHRLVKRYVRDRYSLVSQQHRLVKFAAVSQPSIYFALVGIIVSGR
jgi:hypothetical protein